MIEYSPGGAGPGVRFGEYLETAVPLAHTTTLEEYRRARMDAVGKRAGGDGRVLVTGGDRRVV